MNIAAQVGAGNGHVVGWAKAGEWMDYTVNVAISDSYQPEVRVACDGQGRKFHIEAGGTDITGSMTLPATEGWATYSTVTKTVTLTAGVQELRLVMETRGALGYVGNFDWFKLTAASASPVAGAEATRVQEAVSDGGRIQTLRPAEVITSDDADGVRWGGPAVDGDMDTVWRGRVGAGGWWIALAYDGQQKVSAVDVAWVGPPWPTAKVLGSTDGKSWFPLPGEQDVPWVIQYLWLILPDLGSETTPGIGEIIVQP